MGVYFFLGMLLGFSLMGMLVGVILIWSSKPRRNCDVGTPHEQVQRMRKYCKDKQCEKCPAQSNDTLHCTFNWASLPYVKEERN